MRFIFTSPFTHKNRGSSVQCSPSLKYFILLCLPLLSLLLAACGSTTTASMANSGNPAPTATINIGNAPSSPTPALPGYWCGAWATQTTAPYGTNVVGVYAKFVQNVNGNPVGVANASATATVIWPDGATSTIGGTTGSDGLVTFPVSTSGRADAVMKLVFITVSFSNGQATCNVGQDRAAFFMLTNGTASGTPTTGGAGGTGGTGGIRPGPVPKPGNGGGKKNG